MNNELRQKFYNDVSVFSTRGQLVPKCAGVTFINVGTNPVLIMGSLTLLAGTSIAFGANQDELDCTDYYWSFPVAASAGFTNILVVARKNYLD
jgi:hypothetical protein